MAITDLTGTKWLLNKASADYTLINLTGGTSISSGLLPSGRYYALNYTALPKRMLNNPHSYLYLKYTSAPYYHDQAIYFGYMNDTTSVDTVSTTDPDYYPAIIEFDSVNAGSDKTNSSVIAWFEANATQIMTVDLANLTGWSNVSSGTHTLTIKAKASGYRDSDASTGVSFVKGGTGYNLTINFVARNYAGGKGENYLRIKLNGTPLNDQDYEGYFATPWAGSTGYFDLNGTGVVNVGYDTGGTYTINNMSSFTYWHEYEDGVEGDFIGVNSNSMPAPDWTNKVSTPLTQDTIITVYYDYDV